MTCEKGGGGGILDTAPQVERVAWMKFGLTIGIAILVVVIVTAPALPVCRITVWLYSVVHFVVLRSGVAYSVVRFLSFVCSGTLDGST